MACRRNEAEMLQADVAAGRVARLEGVETMARLRALVEEDLAVARETNQTLQARTAEFELSAEKAREEVQQAPAQPAQPAQPGAPAPTPQERQEQQAEIQKAEAAVQTNQQALSQQSATIEQAAALEQSDAFVLALLIDPSREGTRRATT
jgi:hypothetical protein